MHARSRASDRGYRGVQRVRPAEPLQVAGERRVRAVGVAQSSSPSARKSATGASVGGEVGRRGRPRRPPAPRSSPTTTRRARAAPALPSPSPVAPTGPKLDVVGADLGGGHARRGARRGRRRRRWRPRPSALRAARTWRAPSPRCTPSSPSRGDQAEVVGDHQRHVAGVADRAQRVGGAGDLVLGARRRAPAAGRRCRRRRAARASRSGRRRVEGRRRDQVDPRPRVAGCPAISA